MKILFIGKNLSLGGGERIITNLAGQSGSQKEIFDIAIFEKKNDFGSLSNVKIIPLTPFSDLSSFKAIILFPWLLYKLLVVSRDYDLVLSFERYYAYLNSFICTILKKKAVIYLVNPVDLSLRDIFGLGISYRIHSFLHSIVFKTAFKLVVLSSDIKDELVVRFGIHKSKISIVGGSVNREEIEKLKKEELPKKYSDIFKRNKVVIAVGRLHPQKNFQLLIDIFRLVTQKTKKVILIILGDGTEKTSLQRIISNFHLENKIFLLGYQKNPYRFMVKSDILVLVSKYEGFGMVLLEALGCGIPVVSTYSPFKKVYGGLLLADKVDAIHSVEQSLKRVLDDLPYYQKKAIISSKMILQDYDVIRIYSQFKKILVDERL